MLCLKEMALATLTQCEACCEAMLALFDERCEKLIAPRRIVAGMPQGSGLALVLYSVCIYI
jgi:hypothetical protein